MVGWVFFRAETFDGALNILAGMIGLHGAVLPGVFANISPFVSQAMEVLGILWAPLGLLWASSAAPESSFLSTGARVPAPRAATSQAKA